MGKTVTERAMESALGKLSVEYQAVIFNYLQKIREGFWENWYLDQFIDRHGSGVTLEDALEFAWCHTAIGDGKIVRFKVEVGEHPARDFAVEENNRALANLPFPFSAYFSPKGFGSDGMIEWLEPVYAEQTFADTQKRVDVLLSPMRIPLEVGTLVRGRAWGYFVGFDGRGVARWAYGDTFIRVYYPLELPEI